MGKVFDAIDEKLAGWIGRQRLFFVGTAPSGAAGHVNVSPKGPVGSRRTLAPHRVASLDVIGSGAETIAHLRDDGRIVVMLCAFEGPPRIVRLHGRGTAHQAGTPGFAKLERRTGIDVERFAGPGTPRAFIRVAVDRVADSCGYGVPHMTFD